jgi:hypothetical protein
MGVCCTASLTRTVSRRAPLRQAPRGLGVLLLGGALRLTSAELASNHHFCMDLLTDWCGTRQSCGFVPICLDVEAPMGRLPG